tara:strand:- start:1629 stop:2315 length:687 start_codon:yes stop_codon:yes gene_type:complete
MDKIKTMNNFKWKIVKDDGIICDLDGTIALMLGKRSPYDFLECHNDSPNETVIDVLETMVKAKNWQTIFTTARMNKEIPDNIYRRFDDWTKKTYSNDSNERLKWSILACTMESELESDIFYKNSIETRFTCLRESREDHCLYIHLTDVYSLTLYWILKYVDLDWRNYYMFIRDNGDTDKDRYVKLELYNTYIKPNWNIKLVLDDRNQVVEMWRHGANLPCLQVADGNF